MKNNWKEVVDLILKPRPGGNKLLDSALFFSSLQNASPELEFFSFIVFHSRERVSGSMQGGVGKDSGPRGCPEKVTQQALCGRPAAARPVHVWQEGHHHCLWTGWFFTKSKPSVVFGLHLTLNSHNHVLHIYCLSTFSKAGFCPLC